MSILPNFLTYRFLGTAKVLERDWSKHRCVVVLVGWQAALSRVDCSVGSAKASLPRTVSLVAFTANHFDLEKGGSKSVPVTIVLEDYAGSSLIIDHDSGVVVGASCDDFLDLSDLEQSGVVDITDMVDPGVLASVNG